MSLAPTFGCSVERLTSALSEGTMPHSSSRGDELIDEFVSVASRLGSESPGLLLRLSDDSEALPLGLVALVRAAEAAPHVDVAIVAPSGFGTLDFVVERHASLLREGLLYVEDEASAGAPEEQVLLYDRGDLARSKAERALYRRLESRPSTQGLFALNGRLEHRFGAVALEIDLLSERLRVAVEVDGYHHFRDTSAYRRDRRKDLLLQQLGYLVVRVLASDVEEELEHVLEEIDSAVAFQLARSA